MTKNTIRGLMPAAVLIMAAIVMIAPALRAQGLNPIPFSLAIGPIAGVTTPKGDLGESYNAGHHIGGMAWLSFGQFGVRGEMTYQKMKTPGVAFGTARFSGSLKQTGFLISGTFMPLPTPLVRPYAILGVGSYKTKLKFGDSVSETEIDDESTGFAIAGGVGAKLQISKIGVMLEARYVRASTEGDSIKSLMVSAGLLFSLI